MDLALVVVFGFGLDPRGTYGANFVEIGGAIKEVLQEKAILAWRVGDLLWPEEC